MAITNGMRPIHPGEVLKEDFLIPLNMSVRAVASALGISARGLNDIVLQRRRMTPETALRIARYFGGDARSWLNLQTAYDLRIAETNVGAIIRRQINPRH